MNNFTNYETLKLIRPKPDSELISDIIDMKLLVEPSYNPFEVKKRGKKKKR